MDRDARRVPAGQRVRCYQRHRGWVRAKACWFCQRTCHVDEMGVLAPPWRVRDAAGPTTLTWYCCIHCAKHQDTSEAGWMHKAPAIVPHDWFVQDTHPGHFQPPSRRPRCRPRETKDAAAQVSDRGPNSFDTAGLVGASWADEGEDVKFGSF